MIRSIIFDWEQTLYKPESKQLFPGTFELLNLLKREEIPLVLVEKGGTETMGEIQRLKVTDYFAKLIFLDKQKTEIVFKEYLTETPKDTWIIGDTPQEELLIGKKLGATTVWINQHTSTTHTIQHEEIPTYIVSNLDELYTLFHEQLALSVMNHL